MVVLAQKGLGQFCLTSGQQRLSLTTEFGHYRRELSYWNRHASYGPGIPGWGIWVVLCDPMLPVCAI